MAKLKLNRVAKKGAAAATPEELIRRAVEEQKEEIREKVEAELQKAYENEIARLEALIEGHKQDKSMLALRVRELSDKNDLLDAINRKENSAARKLARWENAFPSSVDVFTDFLEDLCTEADSGRNGKPNLGLFYILRDYGVRVKTRKKRSKID
jgi:hypothetical protein